MPRSRSSSTASSSTGSDPESFADWASDLPPEARQTLSLFDDTRLDSPEEAQEYDKRVYGVDLDELGRKLRWGDYGRIRVINWVRREKVKAEQVLQLTGKEDLFSDDANMIPTLENDPLLQLGFGDFSDDEDDDLPSQSARPQPRTQPLASTSTQPASTKSTSPEDQLSHLRHLLAQSEAKSKRLEELLETMLDGDESGDDVNSCDDTESESEDDDKVISMSSRAKGMGQSQGKGKGKGKALDIGAKGKATGKGKGKEKMDIDTHYFDSYASNDIHETMLKDRIRTMSYGEFILNNPQIFEGAVVMDVGCGTGILSMFAAKAGAKKVFAIEASGLASKARANIKKNGLDHVITVIQGKVEEIDLGDVKEVDVIVSEWMGYALLYEAMLDSVLYARDKFLRPSGLMVPSQTRMVLSGITGREIWEEGVGFWDEVYGFDMSEMKPTNFEEGIVDIVKGEEVVTNEVIVKDIDTHRITVPQLDFSTPFTLTPTSSSTPTTTTIRAFLLWFDTFFSPSSSPSGQAPPEKPTNFIEYGEEVLKREIASEGKAEGQGKGKEVSFTTGPRGRGTHWKQVAFYLKKEIVLEEGDSIKGLFNCRKSRSGNTRELDVEFHYEVVKKDGKSEGTRYDVFRVC